MVTPILNPARTADQSEEGGEFKNKAAIRMQSTQTRLFKDVLAASFPSDHVKLPV